MPFISCNSFLFGNYDFVGTILDRIDYNMEATVEHTKEGLVELQKAEDHQKANLGVKCIIVLAVLIFAMVLVLIFKHQKK